MILNINYYVNFCLTLLNVHYDTLQVFIFFFKEVRRILSDSPFVSSLLLLSENGLNEEIFRVKTFFCYKYCLLTYSWLWLNNIFYEWELQSDNLPLLFQNKIFL